MSIAREANSGSLKTRKWCALVTFDVRNAFNSAGWRQIMMELERKGISANLRKVIGSYLTDRSIDLGDGNTVEVTSGVPQGSVLGPTLWNILYDGVLSLKVPGAMLVAYADDLALTVTSKTVHNLVSSTNRMICKICNWMREKGLEMAPEKTEAVLLIGQRRLKQRVAFDVEGVEIQPKRAVKYLGVHLNQRMTFVEQAENMAARADALTAKLGRLMPNVDGPPPAKRRILCEVSHSIMLYAASVWGEKAIAIKKYKERLMSVQRRSALRVCSAYRTVSRDAALVVAQMVPLDLRIRESGLIRRKTCTKAEARDRSMDEWQRRWNESTKGRWTHRLIPDIKKWTTKSEGKGEVNHYLTQMLTGHGEFRAYLKRMKRAESDSCVYCEEEDTAEHTFFRCQRWTRQRRTLEVEVNCHVTPDNVVEVMMESRENWIAVQKTAEEILKKKTIEVKERTQATV